MTPQFEAACIQALVILAYDQGMPDADNEAIRAWNRFKDSGYALTHEVECGRQITAEEAQEFGSWWEHLTDEEKEIAMTGGDITEPNGEITSEDGVTGTRVITPRACDRIANSLFDNL